MHEIRIDIQDGIQRRRLGSVLNHDASAGAHSRAVLRQADRVHIDAFQAHAGGSRRDGLSDVTQGSAALSAPQHLARQVGTIALDGDIDVIFERQRDHVLRR